MHNSVVSIPRFSIDMGESGKVKAFLRAGSSTKANHPRFVLGYLQIELRQPFLQRLIELSSIVFVLEQLKKVSSPGKSPRGSIVTIREPLSKSPMLANDEITSHLYCKFL
ncbi:MAG: hypothetical protein K9L75_06795 [Spirochaetia bacterium]|nr:hypothetical protein [Spirochaetia bacterium]